jgi:hypothetical protein
MCVSPREMYVFHCILPEDKLVIFQNGHLQQIETMPETYNALIQVVSLSKGSFEIHLHQLGEYFGFEYSPFLYYLHESSLRNYFLWGIDSNASFMHSLDEKKISESLSIGKIHTDVYLQEIGEINGINVGYGLFAKISLACDEFIGEYVGVVMESSTAVSSCSYSLNYPSADKSYVVNAKEIGNLIRFVNHSPLPNASFQPFIYEGRVHVLCVSSISSDLIDCCCR